MADTSAAWQRLGSSRRSGILAPLFSVHSERSVGVGEFRDLEALADWCADCGLSLIQLLPLNDVGTRFCPYDAESSFALEPTDVCLDDLTDIPAKKYSAEISALRKHCVPDGPRYDTNVKRGKLALLRRMFVERAKKKSADFDRFRAEQDHWL